MKQLTDEVILLVTKVLSLSAVHYKTTGKSLMLADTNKALAALDTAQPVQANAMLLEALEQIAANDKHTDGDIVRAALDTAQKAQPESEQSDEEKLYGKELCDCGEFYGKPHDCQYQWGLGHVQQAQPEPTEDSLSKLLHQVIYGDYCGDNPNDLKLALAAKAEYQALKQAQEQPERAPLIPCRCFDEVSKRLCINKNKCVRIEAHGIKQGVQHD